MARVEADMQILKLQVNFHFAYIRPKVVGPFSGPYASRSYVHRAALLCCIFYFAHQMPVFELQNEHTMLSLYVYVHSFFVWLGAQNLFKDRSGDLLLFPQFYVFHIRPIFL
jgi:hypothetical protein